MEPFQLKKQNLKKGTFFSILLFIHFFGLCQAGPYLGWVNTFDSGYSQGFSIDMDSDGNVISVGVVNESFSGTIIYQTTSGIDSIVPTGFPCTIIQKINSEGNTIWIREIESVYGVVANDVAIDNNENILVTGYYQDSTDFDPSASQAIDTGSVQMTFVLKLNQQGDFIWVKTIKNTSGNSRGIAIAVDNSNDIIFTGQFSGTADFDPNIGVTTLSSAGSIDIFICKISEIGNLIWVKSNQGPLNDRVQSMTLDMDQNIILTGNFHDTVDFDPGPLIYNLTADQFQSGWGVVFVQKLDNDGNFKWANAMEGNNVEYGEDLTTDNQGNIYTMGRFNEDIDLDPGPSDLLMVSAGSQDVFIQKVDSLGDLVWGKSFGGISYDFGRGLAATNDGNIYICGYFNLTTDLDPGTNMASFTAEALYDAFLLKLDTAGNYVWGGVYHGNSLEHPARMVLDNQNNIYLTGFFEGSCDFDPSDGSHELQTSGRSIYTAKFIEGYASIPESSDIQDLMIYPNPCKEFCYLNSIETIEKVQLFNQFGQEIKTVILQENRMDISFLAQGVYVLKVYSENGTYTTQLVKY
ncbi:MAG: hypothetical protein ACI857_000061 [Arenicella sp.]|jgi:hypothetical protein